MVPALSADALLRLVWNAPFPALIQGQDHALADINDAFLGLMGYERAQLIGHDLVALEPAEDRDSSRLARHEMMAAASLGQPPPALRRRLLDAFGRQHWFSIATQNVAAAGQPARWLSLLQDVTPEVAAREQTQRAQAELTDLAAQKVI